MDETIKFEMTWKGEAVAMLLDNYDVEVYDENDAPDYIWLKVKELDGDKCDG